MRNFSEAGKWRNPRKERQNYAADFFWGLVLGASLLIAVLTVTMLTGVFP
jgi:hypothetical protein